VVLVLYASSYPWQFQARPVPFDPLVLLLKGVPHSVNRFVVRDFFVNLLLYVPVGLLTTLSLGPRVGSGLRATAGLAVGLVLSFLVELGQYFTPTRTPSLFDVSMNGTGSAIGVALGVLWPSRMRQLGSRLKPATGLRAPGAVLVLACWAGYQLAPFFPVLSRMKLIAKLAGLTTVGTFSTLDFGVSAVEWLAVGRLLEGIVGADRVMPALGWLFLVLPGRLFLEGRGVSLDEAAGAVLAMLILGQGLSRHPRRTAFLGAATLTMLIVAGLSPFRFQAEPQAFSWVPLSGALEADAGLGFRSLLRKSFQYGAMIWLMREAGLTLRTAALATVGVLGGIEIAQTRLPGRTAEITDPVLAVLLALGISWSESSSSEVTGPQQGGCGPASSSVQV